MNLRLLTNTRSLPALAPSATLAVGIFDGVHRGHQAVLRAAMERAKAIGGEAWVLTFEPNPLAILAPERLPPRLTSLEVRRERFEALGLDGCITIPFTHELSKLTPQQFYHDILCPDGWSPDTIFAGENWHFGAGGKGTLATISELGGRVQTVPPVLDSDGVISSTRIRTALQCGDIATANRLLGYEYVSRGVVVQGRKVGRTLGFPTANLQVDTLLPKSGVYAVKVRVENKTYSAIANIGTRPTFHASEPAFEVHILNFDGDLYGQTLDVTFLSRLRDERTFASAEALTKQITEDITQRIQRF